MLEVGRVVKPHGIRGEVVVDLVTDRHERLDAGSVLDADGTALEVESARPHQRRWIVRFAGVVDREGADRLRGAVLRAEPIDDPGALWVHELIGARVRDLGGRDLGLVTAVEANPASDLLVLESGALVPLTFLVSRIGADLVVDLPEGLLDDG
ncbi:MAG TPA: ribosome maturation factor RimM [Acidimicrobiales bacterium]